MRRNSKVVVPVKTDFVTNNHALKQVLTTCAESFFPQLKCSVYISDAVMFVASVSTNLTCKGREGERDLIWC